MRLPFANTRKATEAGSGSGDGHDEERRQIERKVEREVQSILDAQLARVLTEAGMGIMPIPAAFWAGESTLVAAALLPVLAMVVQQAVKLATSDLSEIVAVGIEPATLQARLTRWARNYTFDLIKGIDANTKQAVSEAMQTWVTTGGPLDELKKMLEPTFGPTRSKVIASTETTRAYNMAHLETWRESGVVWGREWRTAMDERVCPICGAMEGAQTALDKPFEGFGIDAPPAHPNCRCWAVPVIPKVRRV